MRTLRLIAFLTLACLLGCGDGETETTPTDGTSSGGETGTPTDSGTGGQVTDTGTAGGGGAEPDPQLVAAGQASFDRVCGTCHPGGDEDIGPSIKDKHLTAERVTEQIRNGSGRMRPIPVRRLSDEDLPGVLAYLRTIGTVQ